MAELEKVVVFQQFSGFEDLFKQFRAGDERPDLDDDAGPTHVVDEAWRRAPIAAAIKAAGATVVFDWGIPSESDIDCEANSPFLKAPQVVRREAAPDAFAKADGTPRTLAKKLGITRSEQITNADGSTWLHGYNAAGELVDARFLKSAE